MWTMLHWSRIDLDVSSSGWGDQSDEENELLEMLLKSVEIISRNATNNLFMANDSNLSFTAWDPLVILDEYQEL